MRSLFDVVAASAGAWSWSQISGLADAMSEASSEPGLFQDISATAILAGLLWFVMRELRTAVDRNADAISRLQESMDAWESTVRELLGANEPRSQG